MLWLGSGHQPVAASWVSGPARVCLSQNVKRVFNRVLECLFLKVPGTNELDNKLISFQK